MGGIPSKTPAPSLDYSVKVTVTREHYQVRYTEDNIAIIDACIQLYYNLNGGCKYISNHFRNLALYFLLPLAPPSYFSHIQHEHIDSAIIKPSDSTIVYALPFPVHELLKLLDLLHSNTCEVCYLSMDERASIGHALCGIKWITQQLRCAAKPTEVGVEAEAARRDNHRKLGLNTERHMCLIVRMPDLLSFVFADAFGLRMVHVSSVMQKQLEEETLIQVHMQRSLDATL